MCCVSEIRLNNGNMAELFHAQMRRFSVEIWA